MRPVVSIAFRPRIEGIEHLPQGRPFLLVANHSAGMGMAEIASFACLYLQKVGVHRPLAGFAHPIGFRVWPLRPILRDLGAVPSTYEAAARTLEQGIPLLVFPGGDHETLRPVWQAGRVDFGGRQGFLRVARTARVPIVPMGIAGSHYTAPMLLRSRTLASLLILPRLLGLKRWGVSLLGLAGAVGLLAAPLPWWARILLAWSWLTSAFVFLPILPWTIRFRIGRPLEPEALFGPPGSDQTDLDAPLAQVTAAVQRLVSSRARR